MLFALFWTSLLRAQTPASVFTPNQRTTPLSSLMISVASYYPPGLGPGAHSQSTDNAALVDDDFGRLVL
jgi:hypothetical protein